MAKFDIKKIGGSILTTLKTDGVNIVTTTAAVIGTQKFLDFKTLFPNVKPEEWYMKHEGLVKVGTTMVALSFFPKLPMWAKCLFYGLAIQGGIKSVQQYTMNAEGKAFVDKIGAGEYDDQIKAMAEEIKKASLNGVGSITANNYSSVAGPNNNPSVTLMNNSSTGVAGMGMSDEDDWRGN